jgi:hypothetical protein
MGMNGNQADRALGRKRAKPFLDPAASQAIAAPARNDLDRNEVAVLRIRFGSGRDGELLPKLAFVDRLDAPSAAGPRSENAEHACTRAIDELDHTAVVANSVVLLAALLDAQQSAIADAHDLVRSRPPANVNTNLGRGPVLAFVPFGGDRQELAIGVPRGDIREHHVG